MNAMRTGPGMLHTELYFQRMASSLGDKARLLEHLVPGSALDIGAGEGALVRLLRAQGRHALGVDAVPASVERSDGTVVLGTCPGLGEVVEPGWDNVIACSVMHEIHSYNEPSGTAATMRALIEMSKLLRPGGHLVIRDGVGPEHPYLDQRVIFADPDDAGAFIKAWGEISEPLGVGRAYHHVQRGRDGSLNGPAWAITAFLMVYTWGWESIEREAREDYTIAGSLQGAAETMTSVVPMELIHAESYAQPGYGEHLAPRCQLEHRPTAEHRWQPCPWPDTNAIWVLRAPDPDRSTS